MVTFIWEEHVGGWGWSGILKCDVWHIPFVQIVSRSKTIEGKHIPLQNVVLSVAGNRQYLGDIPMNEAKEIAIIALRTYIAAMNIALNEQNS